MQFLLNNQAAHDARLAEMEVNLNKLSQQTSDLAHTQREIQAGMLNMQGVVQSMQGVIQTTQSEFREGLQRILEVSEQTMAAVRQLAEAEARTIRRVGVLEDRIDALENPGE